MTGSGEKHPLHHVAVLPPRVGPTPDALPAEAVEVLSDVAMEELSDAVGALYTMDAGMRAAYLDMPRVVGAALTVKAAPGDNLAVYGGVSLARDGHVLVVDWRGTSHTCGAGALALASARRRGLIGVVVDGAWRDIEDLAADRFPIVSRSRTLVSGGKSALGELNVPVACGGVVVHPGDAVVADCAGTVIVPREHLDRVVTALAQRAGTTPDREAPVAQLIDAYWAQYARATGGEEA